MKHEYYSVLIKILSYSVVLSHWPVSTNFNDLIFQCLMPEYFEPQIEEISEAALQERIKLKKVKASVDIFDQLLQAGD